jgi:hypothetical protein
MLIRVGRARVLKFVQRTHVDGSTIPCKSSVYILSVECSRTKNSQPSIINVQGIVPKEGPDRS